MHAVQRQSGLLTVHGGQTHLHTSSMLWASSKMRTASFRSIIMAWRITGSCRVKDLWQQGWLEKSWKLAHVKYYSMPFRVASDRDAWPWC